MISLRGNWDAGLARLEQRMQGFAHGDVQRDVLEAAADGILEAQRHEIETGIDPDGRRYATPKDGGTPMRRSGRLLRSAKTEVSGGRVTITFDAPYAGVLHRRGRKLVPTGGGFGRVWGPRILPALRRVLGLRLAGKGGR